MRIIKTFVLLLVFCQGLVFAAGKYSSMVLDTGNSSVNFATIKKQYIVESARFEGLSGSIKNGDAALTVKTNSIKTGIPIRDQRLSDIFFQSDLFPNVNIHADIGEKALNSKKNINTIVPLKIRFFGKQKEIEAEVLIVKSYKKKLVVASMKPIILSAKDFSIPISNLEKLSKTVGGIPLSDKVAINFVLTFVSNN